MTVKEAREQLNEWIDRGDSKLLRMLYAVGKEYYRGQDPTTRSTQENNDLYRLVYTSARSEDCDDASIKQILEASRRNNAGLDITGMLIHTPKRFLQVLEGPLDQVMTLYQKIEKDDRHGGSTMRFCEPVKERHFGDWHMAGKEMQTEGIGFLTDITEEEKKLYQSFMDGDLNSYTDEGMRVIKSFLLVS